MSQKSVEIVIGKLATDEALRAQFLTDPMAALDGLSERGLELNPAEREALLAIPKGVWIVMPRWIHPRLQKIALSPNRPNRADRADRAEP
jgi:hypothetical protein